MLESDNAILGIMINRQVSLHVARNSHTREHGNTKTLFVSSLTNAYKLRWWPLTIVPPPHGRSFFLGGGANSRPGGGCKSKFSSLQSDKVMFFPFVRNSRPGGGGAVREFRAFFEGPKWHFSILYGGANSRPGGDRLWKWSFSTPKNFSGC